MALLKWYDEEDKQEEDSLNSQPTTQIASVQSSWQPTAQPGEDGADGAQQPQQDNYLMSDEKAQVDSQLQQRREAEAAAKAEAARQAAIARENNARAREAAEAAEQAQVQQPKEYKPKNAGEAAGDFFQGLAKGLLKGGAGAVGSLASAISSLFTGDADNDVTNATKQWQEEADDLGNSVHANGVGDFIGSLPGGIVSGIVDPANYMVRGVRNTPEMLVASIAAGSGDKHLRQAGIDLQKELQARQFGDDVAVNGDGAMLMEGIAKPGEVILNVATAGGGSTAIQVSKPVWQRIAASAVKEGIINVGAGVPLSVLEQAARGQEITWESVGKDAFLQGATGATIGGLSQGYAISKNRGGIRENASQLEGELTPVERAVEDIDQRPVEDGNINFEQENIRTEAPVADGVVTPVSPDAPQYTPVADNLTPVVDDGVVTPEPLTEAPDQLNGQTPPDWNEATAKEVAAVREQPAPEQVEAPTVADGTAQMPTVARPAADPNMPVVKAEEVRALQESRAGTSQAEEAVSEWAKRVYSQTDLHKDMKRRLAAALGKEKDAELEIGELLSGTKVSGKGKAAIIERYNRLETLSKEFNKLMQGNRKLFQADTPESIRQGISQLDEATSRKANKLIDAYGRAERDLNGYIRKVQGQKSLANRVVNALQNVTGARNASLLSSVGGIERNITQELGANILDAVMHPVKYVKGMPQLVPEVMRSYKRAFREYTVKPKTLSEVLPYTIGNTYRVLMSPVTGQANYRKGVMRETLAESLLRAEGLNPTRAEIKKFAGSMGADSEVVANNLAGIMNGMTSHTNGLKVMKNYQDFIHTGSAEAKEAFMKNAERSSNLAAKLSRVGAESDNPKVRAAASLMNIVMPFVTTATNMAKTAATYNLNPMARSVPDEVMKAVRSNPANTLALLKANAVKGGVLAGVYGLYAAGIVQYNNGDEVDKPRGISIDLGNGEFFPVRGTPIEMPIAGVVTAAMLADDIADGKVKDWRYYGGILGNSLPYIDSTNNFAAAIVSALDSAFSGNADQGTGDNGYAAKAYGINMAKSFVPYSNNGVEAGVNAWQGKSTNAKSSYDGDMGKWFGNAVGQAYSPAFRATLKDSRDASGRVRTVDQQGGFRIQKGINDELTKVHNDTIDNLVKYGRDNGLGRGTQDMFNTYDTGKNNNFKGVQDAITFLDVEEGADGKKSPKSEDKLKDNEKLADLATQIRDGFYGDTGDNLLMLGGEQLYSDASVPNKNGTKNSRLPISMQSIKNAIAATDLPEDQRNRMYEISQTNQELYNRRKAGEISYDQEQALKAQNEQEYVNILSNSENYKKLGALMMTLDEQGFFEVGGIGSTKSGQTYLWNSLNSLLGSKGATPAAQWDSGKSFTPYGRGGGSGRGATYKPGDYKNEGIKWTPVGKRQMASVKTGKYTPVNIKVKLGNAVKKNKTQNYSDRSF